MTKLGTPVRRRASSALLALAGLLLAGCATTVPGSGSPSGSTESATSAGSTTTPSTGAVVRTLGKTGWYRGFAITVVKATLTPDRSSGSAAVAIDLSYQNLGEQNETPDGSGYLTVGDQVVTGSFDSPTVPGSGKATGKFTARIPGPRSSSGQTAPPVDTGALLDSSTLVYGQASDNQTKIPLSAGGTVGSVEPRKLSVAGSLNQGQIVVVDLVTGSLAPSYKAGEKGKATLDLRIKVSCGPQCLKNGVNVGREQFSVRTPDGTSVVADSRSQYCCDAIYPGTVSDNIKNVLTFVVPQPGTGNYLLTFTVESLAANGAAPGTLTFTA